MKLFTRKKKSGSIFTKKPEISADGTILEIVNSYPTTNSVIGQCLQRSEVIFIQVSISTSGDSLIAGDVHGNLFVFDFAKNKFELVKHLSMPASCLSTDLKHKTHFLVGLSDYSLRCYDWETGTQIACLRGHESSITGISLHSSKRYALSTSYDTAFLWNLDTFERKRKLSISKSVDLLTATFMPNTNSIMTCFKDNSILIWNAETMDLLYELKSTQALDITYREFSSNFDGSIVAAAGKCHLIHIWDIGLQRIVKVLQLPLDVKSVKQVVYLPKSLYPEELLAAVCSNGVLRIIDVKACAEIWATGCYEHKVTQVCCAAVNGNLVCLMDSGNINVIDLRHVIKTIADSHKDGKPAAGGDGTLDVAKATKNPTRPKATRVSIRNASRIKEMINQRVETSTVLNHSKLCEILKEYGQFPEKYRTFIWKTLLQLPENFEAYSALLEKGIHPSYADIQKIFPIRSLKLLRVFQRLLSAVAFWAPVATECTFLPMLTFPFAKLLQNNQLLMFEVVATVLVNWCQKWFDFLPNPPLNIMSMIENVLAYHDKELFQHFIKYRVTTQVYAWSLLQTGFSEVLCRNEWMRLWDHIIVNQPYWMLMAVVSYSLINRNSLLDCYEFESFKQFYRHHNGTGVSQVIKETYKIIKTSPSQLNPQNNLSFFTPLHQGQYQLLAKFPQRIKNFPQNEIDRIRQEQIDMLKSDDLVIWNKR